MCSAVLCESHGANYSSPPFILKFEATVCAGRQRQGIIQHSDEQSVAELIVPI